MNKTVKWILIGVGGVVALLAIMKFTAGASDSGVKVAVEKAAKRTIVETVNASGKVYPEIEVKVSPDISGEIVDLTVQEGDSVRKGQVLARIYADIYSSQRDQAAAQVSQSQASVANSSAALESLRAQLEQDQQAYTRNKQLFDEKVISKSEFEQYETKLRSSQAQFNAAQQNIRALQAGALSTSTQLQMANKNLGRATIVAPMSGVISMLNVKKGERVVGTAQMAGTEMMRVADMATMEVRVDVGENDIVKISIGDEADVQVDAYNNRKFKGQVTQIASSTKTGTAAVTSNDVTNYEVHIRLDPSSYADLMEPGKSKKFPFRPGMNASADIKTKRKENVIAVPITSVAARIKGSDKNIDQKKKEAKRGKDESEEDAVDNAVSDELEEVVFLVKEGKVEKKVVKTGIQDINYIEITSGLSGNEEIVIAPYNAVSKTLKSGTKVKVVEKDKLFER
ncbi:efflux RND transporter periplasmic adaptor subunit [Flavisolibacter tropicus]|uniref:RND transporter n=1 Tax=Flavisolibacter tropicus TaxID=1492898 RepID=A0A172TZG9_9BACT|nr:efflux RND transporter periplasmic adaptor subunit [Flavisolibacter tropicus]ANE52485.1 RND transporter [Flavisolibacter tropicus]